MSPFEHDNIPTGESTRPDNHSWAPESEFPPVNPQEDPIPAP